VKTRAFKVKSSNSIVCGYPGRKFDWSKLDWEGKETYFSFGKGIKSSGAWVDDSWLQDGHYVYFNVPYDFASDAQIYRIRARDSMYPGNVYHGRLVKELRAVKKEDGWYWSLEFNES